ncbi:MAG: hypothetical protein O3B87_04795 [bacterium]|nr:hypothetical protein [bacterium]
MEDVDVIDEKPISFGAPVITHVSDSVAKENNAGTILSEPVDISFASSNIDVLSKAQEDTRAKIALTFTHSFLIIIAVCLFLPFILKAISENIFPSPMDSAKDLLTTTASILSGPFGFIVGFYFKQTNKNG